MVEFKIYDSPQRGVKFKEVLVKERGYKCQKCGLSEWNGLPIPLEVHHINGNKYDNRKENLQLLCPNCHTLTPNFGNKNKPSSKKVSDEDLLKSLRTSYSIREALLKVGLSDTGVQYARARKILNQTNTVVGEELPPKEHRILDNKCKICGRSIGPTATYCIECSHKMQQTVKRPSRNELKRLVRTLPFTTIAAIYDVTDNAIRRWCDAENIPRKKKDINAYSDEEWAKI